MSRPIHFLRPDERSVEMLPWTDAELDQMSQISEGDKRTADAYWRRYLPKRLRDLLRARTAFNDNAVPIQPF